MGSFEIHEQHLFWIYSENRIADVTKIDVMRLSQSGYNCMPFSHQKTGEDCQKNTITGYPVYSEQTSISSILSILLSRSELTEYYSVHSRIRIGPKRIQSPSIPCILNFWDSPKRMCPGLVLQQQLLKRWCFKSMLNQWTIQALMTTQVQYWS